MFDDRYNGLTLDEAAEKAGGYVRYRPGDKSHLEFDFRALSKYCRERGVEPIDLPEEELSIFRIDSPLASN